MPFVESEFALSADPRFAAPLADHATSARPAWLWSTDGSRLLWANAVGAAIFGAKNTSECAARRFEAKHPAARQIIRLAATLPSAGQPRLERLRSFGAAFGRPLTCICSRLVQPDSSTAILVIATEPAGPKLTLRERVSRLLPDGEHRVAVFATDGTLLYATTPARRRFAGAPTLSALGLSGLATQALAAGRASGATAHGPVRVQRLGSDLSTALAVTFGAEPMGAHMAQGAAAKIEPTISSAGPAAPIEPSPRSSDEPVASDGGPPTAQPTVSAEHERPVAERRHPLRFVWQMDADGRFVVGSDEFIELVGPRTTAAFGRLWSEIAAELKLDPEDQVVRAVATRETWSGIIVSWPVDEDGERLPVELSGLPVFDRDRDFRGYRGFGVCRDIARINQLVRARRERPTELIAPRENNDIPQATPQHLPSADPEAAAGASPRPAEVAAAVAPSTAPRTPSVPEPAANVVPFRPGPTEPKAPSLSPVERKAFRELAQELTARLRGGREGPVAESGTDAPSAEEPGASRAADEATLAPSSPEAMPAPLADEARHEAEAPQVLAAFESVLLDRIPVGVLIHRQDSLLYANRCFLELSGYESLDAFAAAGGLNALFATPAADRPAPSGGAQAVLIVTRGGERRPVEGRMFTIPWAGASALALILTAGGAEERATAPLSTGENEIRALTEKLASYNKSEEELRAATRAAQKAAAAKADFIGKVSHEIRTPLNAITGFTEVIMAERFGPIGNERYREYLKDMHAAEMHLVSTLNDLFDLSKIESGQLDLTFANVSLNDLTQQCVGIMQPQASRARIIIRTSLTPGLPQVVADERSLRQIVLNLLSNSIRFTGPGGQVIVSTAFADSGEAVLRVRDTGIGMSEADVEAALEPFGQTATSGSWGPGATGLGLPLTKALAEANRAHFSVTSAPNAGTLIEVAFPPTRVVAQ
jgi:PAS domain S-box-containing protein